MNPLLQLDSYKLFHRQMYPEGTSLVYSNWTPRSNKRYTGKEQGVVVAGIQMMVRKLKEDFDEHFFEVEKHVAVYEYAKHIRDFTGMPDYDVSHIEALWDLGYLPIVIKALPEGVVCPIGVPCVTVYNTHPDFFWLTNYLETYFSAELWGTMTSATTAREFRVILEKYGKLTGVPSEFIDWQGHDFSMRGMFGCDAAAISGVGHLLSFKGTDTIPAYVAAKKYYDAEGLVASSVPASEHSVQCAHYQEGMDEESYMRHMLDTFPTGIVSIVCDGFDYWKFVTETLPKFKDEILARDGRVVIRPDSGNIVDMVAGFDVVRAHADDKLYNVRDIVDGGYTEAFYEPKKGALPATAHEIKGSIETLWDIFGGTEVEGTDGKKYKHLNPHIGLIYGDGVNLKRCEKICKRLVAKGFSTNNLVLGIGSFTYQFNTRDTLGFAMKATYIQVNGKGKEIFKDPATKGAMTKKSHRGLLSVGKDNKGGYYVEDQVSWEEEKFSYLREVFRDGELLNQENLETIRKRVAMSLKH